jgi:hypothetical protein
VSIPFLRRLLHTVEDPASDDDFLFDDKRQHVSEAFQLSPPVVWPFLELCGPRPHGSSIFQHGMHTYIVLNVGHDVVARPDVRLVGFLPATKTRPGLELLMLCGASSGVIILVESSIQNALQCSPVVLIASL